MSLDDFEFHPEAGAEILADIDWFEEREFGLGERFAAAVRASIEDAVESPEGWSVTEASSGGQLVAQGPLQTDLPAPCGSLSNTYSVMPLGPTSAPSATRAGALPLAMAAQPESRARVRVAVA